MKFNEFTGSRFHSFTAQTLLALGLFGFSSGSSFAQDTGTSSAILRPSDNLKMEGIPSIPISLADKVRKYTEARGASVLDWHPTQRTMLISTRFANSNQVHQVSAPGGSRYQLTFFNEPVNHGYLGAKFF